MSHLLSACLLGGFLKDEEYISWLQDVAKSLPLRLANYVLTLLETDEDARPTASDIQRWAIRWALGCVNPVSWLPLAAGREVTQPRTYLIAQL